MWVRPLHDIQREYILDAFEFFGFDLTRTAEALEISLRSMRYHVRRYEKELGLKRRHFVGEKKKFHLNTRQK